MNNTCREILKDKEIVFPILLISLIGFYVFKDYLLLNKLYIFKDVASDSYNLVYPFITHVSDYLRSDGIPQWSFSWGMGQNIYPGYLNQPFTLILYLLGREKLVYVFGYIEYFKAIIAGLFFYLYLKKIGISHYFSTLGSLLFAFSGYLIIGGAWYVHSSTVMYGAFLLFAFEKLFKDNSLSYLPLAIVFIATQSAFYLYTFGMFIFLYSIFRHIDENGLDLKGFSSLFYKMILALFIALCISSIFLVNDIVRMVTSPRVTGGLSKKIALSSFPVFGFEKFSHNLTILFRFFSSDMLGSANNFIGWRNYFEAPAFYCGLVNLLAAPQIFIFLEKRRKKIFSIYILFWIVLLIFPYFRYMFYLFTGDYYKGGLSLFIPATLLYISARSFQYIDNQNRINVKLLVLTLSVLIGVLYFPYVKGYEITNIAVKKMATVFLLLYAVLLFLLQREGSKLFAKRAMLLIVAFELATFSSITVNDRQVLTVEELIKKVGFNDYTVDAVNFLKNKDKDFYRIEKDYTSGTAKYGSTNDSQIQKYYGTPSYSSFNQKYYLRFLTETEIIDPKVETQARWAKGVRNNPFLQTLVSVKYNLSKHANKNIFFGYSPISQFGDIKVFENTLFLPLGFTYDKTMTISEFKKLSPNQKDISFFKACITENTKETSLSQFGVLTGSDIPKSYLSLDDYSNDIKNLKENSLQITGHNNNKIEGTIKLDKVKVIFFSIPHDAGWSLTVDGVKQKLHLINIGFMGAVLNKGDHKIVLRYQIPYILPSAIFSFLGLILYSVIIYTSHTKKLLNR